MSRTLADTNLELFTEDIESAADEYDVDVDRLVEVLETMDEELARNAYTLHNLYTEEFEISGDDAVVVDAGHFEVLYVYPEDWQDFQADFGFTDAERDAAQKAHNDSARRMGADEDVLASHDAVVKATPIVGRLMTAGLSRRQAEVQALRMDGATHEMISDELGMATGTVKSHCKRIDEKKEKAEKLTEIVEDE